MRKLTCMLVVLAFAAPALALDPCEVQIKAYDDGSGQLRLTATVSDTGDDMVGLSFTVTLTDATLAAESDVLYVDPCYPVFLDYAHDEIENIPGGWDPETDPTPYNFDPMEGHPIADTSAAGDPNLPASEFSLCLGRLDPCAAPQGVEQDLVILQLTKGAGDTTGVNFGQDDLRGRAVGSEFTVTLPAPGTTTINFVAGPSTCWTPGECTGQTLGDGNCDGTINLDDLDVLKAAIFNDFGQVDYNACSDYDRTCSVNLDDLDILKANIFDGISYSVGTTDEPTTCP